LPVEIIPAKPHAVTDSLETVPRHPGTGVHLHPGILFEIIADRVHLSRIPQVEQSAQAARESGYYRGCSYTPASAQVVAGKMSVIF